MDLPSIFVKNAIFFPRPTHHNVNLDNIFRHLDDMRRDFPIGSSFLILLSVQLAMHKDKQLAERFKH